MSLDGTRARPTADRRVGIRRTINNKLVVRLKRDI